MLTRGSMKKLFCILIAFAVITFSLFIVRRNLDGAADKHAQRFKLQAKLLSQGSNPDLGTDFALDNEDQAEDFHFPPPKLDSLIGQSSQLTYETHLADPSLVDELQKSLRRKTINMEVKKQEIKPVCNHQSWIANSCVDKCLRLNFTLDLRERISQLVTPRNLQIPSSGRKALQEMAQTVVGQYEFMIISAVSSNHFMEMQAFLHNLHTNIYPHFKNFTLLLYNIGLTYKERHQMVKFCKCQVLDFPFHKFPNFVSKNLCYAWKPIIIKAHIHQANTLVWADSSVRFDRKPEFFSSLLQQTEKTGILLGASKVVSPFRTFRETYHFFGDEPCVYLNMPQVQATIGFYKREFFIDRAVLQPWVACAIAESCICPVQDPSKNCVESKHMANAWEEDKGPIVYGLCHRFDQSVISLILHKLFRGSFHQTLFHIKSYMEIKRKDAHVYFESLASA